ncbi:hypothetical protein Trydic_g14889 [Trypoxylus dichotomus]
MKEPIKRNNNPSKGHWKGVKRLFRHLKGALAAKLEFNKESNHEIIGFCDPDWAAKKQMKENQSLAVSQDGAFSWCTRKQKTVALSTAAQESL